VPGAVGAPLVRERGVDGQPVVAADVDEVASQRADRVTAVAEPLVIVVQRDVDGREVVLGTLFFGVLDVADNVTGVFDDEWVGVGIEQSSGVLVDVEVPPPRPDARLCITASMGCRSPSDALRTTT
jgi:hypothetical protein